MPPSRSDFRAHQSDRGWWWQRDACCRKRSDAADCTATSAHRSSAAFGNGGVYLERFIDRPRHIEVQIVADHHGNAIHLHERDCSVQRRHQKLIEEAPSSTLTPEQRKGICEAAVRLVREASYTNAGDGRVHCRSNRQFLLHRSQRAHSSRTPSDRNDHRCRLDQRNRSRSLGCQTVANTGSSAVQRSCDRVPHQCRGIPIKVSSPTQARSPIFSPLAVSACGSIHTLIPATQCHLTMTR